MDISGSTAIVTGGASGLGAAAVQRLVADGASVAILDIDATRGRALERAGGRVVFECADVTDEAATERAIEAAAARLGPIRVLVNAAGFGSMGATATPSGPLPLAEFRRLIFVNLVGSFNVARLVAARMIHNAPVARTGRGVIIHTASIAGLEGRGMAAYSANKAGVITHGADGARLARGIRVCSIAPGLFETPLLITCRRACTSSCEDDSFLRAAASRQNSPRWWRRSSAMPTSTAA
jgi:NAD(P)-dependent dehydrogenase (short-subunit alcohol dehydrogenase family)